MNNKSVLLSTGLCLNELVRMGRGQMFKSCDFVISSGYGLSELLTYSLSTLLGGAYCTCTSKSSRVQLLLASYTHCPYFYSHEPL